MINVRFINMLEGYRERASVSLPGTRQREGGAFRAANEQIAKIHDSKQHIFVC